VSFVSRYLDPELIERLNQLQVSARSVVEGAASGLHRSPVKGASIEFRQHRFYAPGDEPRRLDWRVLGRTDRPYIKEYDEETNLRALLVMDGSGSMEYGERGSATRGETGVSKYDYGARMVAGLAYLMLGQTESVGLMVAGPATKRGRAGASQLTQKFGSGGADRWLAPHAGTMQLTRVLDALERTMPRGKCSLAEAMHEAAERLERRSLVVVVSDFFQEIGQLRHGLAHLRHDRHEVMAVQVLDADEVEFPFRSWLRFRGLEGERSQLVESALARKTYLERFAEHQKYLQEGCRDLGVEYYLVLTREPVVEALTGVLRRRAGRKQAGSGPPPAAPGSGPA
jgi:uncharacterized protein (DUF58 family)